MLGKASPKWFVIGLLVTSSILIAGALVQLPSYATPNASPFTQAAGLPLAAPAGLQYGADLAPIATGLIPARLDRVKELGFTYAQYYLNWKDVEPYRDLIRWNVIDPVVVAAYNRNIKLVFRIYRTPAWVSTVGTAGHATQVGRFVEALVRRYNQPGYPQGVAAYVIWNEPNTSTGWEGQTPNAAAYVAMLREAYKAAKGTNPAIVVVSAGLAPTNGGAGAVNDLTYLDAMYTAGLNDVADVVGMSGLGFHDGPDDTSDPLGYNFSRLTALRQVMVNRGAAARPAAALEVGWAAETPYSVGPGFEWWQVSPETQALYLRSAMKKAAREWPWLIAMFIWNLDFYYDSQEPEKAAFAILGRPAFNCVKLSTPVCPHPVYLPLLLRH